MTTNPKRERLIDAATTLFHQRGLAATSLADIAAKAEIPIGNVYYYFKTKEELALCALEKQKLLMEETYHLIDATTPDPRQRLKDMVQMFEQVKEEYARYGCPVGRFICETTDIDHRVSQAAVGIFERFVTWASVQFEKLGHTKDARRYATSLMSAIQGATVLSKARASTAPLTEEIERLTGWIDDLPNKSIRLGKVG